MLNGRSVGCSVRFVGFEDLRLLGHTMRRRGSFPHNFEDQIAAEKVRLEAQAAELPHGPEKEALLKKIRQLDIASHVNEWLSSPELRAPN
jgi:hypothetical protein